MSKTIILLVALALIASVETRKGLNFQFGNNLASLTRSGSRYNGVVVVPCSGGDGAYTYAFSGLPAGWTA